MRLFALLVVACSGTGSAPGPAPEAAGPAKPHLEPPFSAAELRAGLPAGTEIKLRVVAAGQPPVIQHWTFTAADEKGCTIHARILGADGSLIRDEGSGTSSWAELESHAHFPRDLTTRSDSTVEVPAGRFETWLFEVKPARPGDPLRRFHFAKELPGPPVSMEVIADGETALSMQLISRTGP